MISDFHWRGIRLSVLSVPENIEINVWAWVANCFLRLLECHFGVYSILSSVELFLRSLECYFHFPCCEVTHKYHSRKCINSSCRQCRHYFNSCTKQTAYKWWYQRRSLRTKHCLIHFVYVPGASVKKINYLIQNGVWQWRRENFKSDI